MQLSSLCLFGYYSPHVCGKYNCAMVFSKQIAEQATMQIIVHSFTLACCSELACSFTSREAYQYSNTTVDMALRVCTLLVLLIKVIMLNLIIPQWCLQFRSGATFNAKALRVSAPTQQYWALLEGHLASFKCFWSPIIMVRSVIIRYMEVTISLFSLNLSLCASLFISLSLSLPPIDDWKSIFGDPTKFGFGLICMSFGLIHFLQHYVVYRRAWMKEYKLGMECNCTEGVCKHSKETVHVSNIIASLGSQNVTLKKVEYYIWCSFLAWTSNWWTLP